MSIYIKVIEREEGIYLKIFKYKDRLIKL